MIVKSLFILKLYLKYNNYKSPRIQLCLSNFKCLEIFFRLFKLLNYIFFICRNETFYIVGWIIFSAIMLVSLILNTLIIIVIRKTKEFRHSQYVYKISIAVSDIIWSLCLCILSGYGVYIHKNFFILCQQPDISFNTVSTVVYVNCKLICNIPLKFLALHNIFMVFNSILLLLATISFTVSLVSLIFSAADRYFALAHPFTYRSTNTIKVAKISTAFIWILNIFTFLYALLENKAVTVLFQPSPIYKELSFFKKKTNQGFVSVLLFVLFFLLWLFTFLTLLSLYKTYKRSLRLNRSVKENIAPEKQMSLVLVAMVVAFTFSLFPTLYNTILLYINKNDYIKKKHEAYIKLFIAVPFLITNSIWNILVYNILNKKFRTAFKALFKTNKSLLNDKKIALKSFGPKTLCTKK